MHLNKTLLSLVVSLLAIITSTPFADAARPDFLYSVNERNFINGTYPKKIITEDTTGFKTLFEVNKTLGDFVQDPSGTIFACGNYYESFLPRTAILKIAPSGETTEWNVPGLFQEQASGIAFFEDNLFVTSGSNVIRIDMNDLSTQTLSGGIHPTTDVLVKNGTLYTLSRDGQVKIFDAETLQLQRTFGLPFMSSHSGSGYTGLAIDANDDFLTTSYQFLPQVSDTYPIDFVSKFYYDNVGALTSQKHMQVTFTGNASAVLADIDIAGNGSVSVGSSLGGYAVEIDPDLNSYEAIRLTNYTGDYSYVAVANIPEPSSAVLGLLGTCFIAMLRRRA